MVDSPPSVQAVVWRAQFRPETTRMIAAHMGVSVSTMTQDIWDRFFNETVSDRIKELKKESTSDSIANQSNRINYRHGANVSGNRKVGPVRNEKS
jgi:hypothetical protein